MTCPCPRCGGTVKAERGHTAWVYLCGHCGGAWDLLVQEYGVAPQSLYDGPTTAQGIPWSPAQQRRRGPPDPIPSAAEFADYQLALRRNPEALKYLHSRGLSDASIRRWRLGYGAPNLSRPPGFLIPVPLPQPKTYRIRYWPEPWQPPANRKEVKYSGPAGRRVRLWPFIPSGGQVILTEGELDAALALQHGLRVVASPGMQVSAKLATQLGRAVDRVAVVFDVGSSAATAADRAVSLLRAAGSEAWAVQLPLPNEHDDLGTWFQTGHTAQELLTLIKQAKGPR